VQRGARDGGQRNVVIGEMKIGSVKMIADERASQATLFPAGTEHEVIHDELAVLSKQLRQFENTLLGVEGVSFFDLNSWQRATFP